ncbi:MAG: GNAT family N-acetyltransferase [Clostridiaceae bacterium]|nr:GNAT family N-acetyltransferase [Clostridiaceae bacterium]
MLTPLTPEGVPAFTAACAHEHVFGSKALTALRAHGLSGPACRFWHCGSDAALCLSDGVLLLSAAEGFPTGPVAELARREQVQEIDTTLPAAQALQRGLGGTLETSFFMEYRAAPPEPPFPPLIPGRLPDVFEVLCASHEYYRTHLDYPSWSEGVCLRLGCGLAEVWQLDIGGAPAAVGAILSSDEECAVIGPVAVRPEHRHQGLGAAISLFLTARALGMGKTPRLVSGYDAVAELYRKIGYTECGRWGELYL